ncbi:MAG: CBU_0592 family membrane protein [Candidatus Pacearchaeota archaeon]
MMIEVIGWVGAFLLLLAYFLLIHKNLSSRSKLYQWMNIIGSLMLGINTFLIKAYPSFLTNIIWFFIGLYGIFHIVKHNKTKNIKKR